MIVEKLLKEKNLSYEEWLKSFIEYLNGPSLEEARELRRNYWKERELPGIRFINNWEEEKNVV